MLPELPHITPGQRLLSRPSWCDASLMVYLNEFAFDSDTLVAGVIKQIVAPNPKRWAIGFTLGVPASVTTYVSNMERPDLWGSAVTGNVRDSWWTIFEHGSMIQAEWYAFCSAIQVIGWWEITIGAMENDDTGNVQNR